MKLEEPSPPPNKRLKLAQIHNKSGKRNSQDKACNTHHRACFVEWCLSVIYWIFFTCGAANVGQAGRWLNTSLREHSSSLRAVLPGHRVVHIRDCGCTPIFHNFIVVHHRKEKTAWELYIRSIGNQTCNNSPSLFLYVPSAHSWKRGGKETYQPLLQRWS